MLISKTVKIKWCSNNKEWYLSKGYIFTKMYNEFEVKVEDLQDGSNVNVKVKCDNCEKTWNVQWNNYLKCVKDNKTYFCNKCATKLFGVQKSNITRFKNSKSFYDWCYKNLPKEEVCKKLSD